MFTALDFKAFLKQHSNKPTDEIDKRNCPCFICNLRRNQAFVPPLSSTAESIISIIMSRMYETLKIYNVPNAGDVQTEALETLRIMRKSNTSEREEIMVNALGSGNKHSFGTLMIGLFMLGYAVGVYQGKGVQFTKFKTDVDSDQEVQKWVDNLAFNGPKQPI